MKMSLLVADGVHTGKEIPVDKLPFLMGRARNCQLRPASEMVSNQHCAVLSRAGKVYVHDFNSTNGTFVNNVRITHPTELHDGDMLKVGPILFSVRLDTSIPVNQPTPLPEPPSGESSDDEIAAMLLDMEDPEAETEHQTTIFELPTKAAEEPRPLVQPPSRPAAPAASSSEAALKLLGRMARRDRK